MRDAYLIACVLAAPVALWCVWEVLSLLWFRVASYFAARRIIRSTWGAGHP